MAIIYFTNNADSGDGTLRAAITSASAGDIIEPQGFPAGDVEILLSSYLPTKGVEIRGGSSNRIVLNGQNVSDFFRLSGALDFAFTDVDFKNGYRSTAGTINASGFNSLTFTRCRILNNSGAYAGFLNMTSAAAGTCTFNSCLAFGNTAAGNGRGGVVFCASSAPCTINVNNCTFAGTTDGKGDIVDGGQTTASGSIIQNINTEGQTLAAADFVHLSGGDLRLAVGSQYLTGGASTGSDLLGHTRTGSRGAFDGSWIVSPAEIEQNTTADYIEVKSGVIEIPDGVFLTAKRGGTFTGGVIMGGYFARPVGVTISSQLLNVKTTYYGAHVSGATVTADGVAWSATSPAVPVLVELRSGTSWQTIGQDATGGTLAYSVPLNSTVRVFDGESFHAVTLAGVSEYWQVKAWATTSNGGGTDPSTGEPIAAWTVSAYAITPNLEALQ